MTDKFDQKEQSKDCHKEDASNRFHDELHEHKGCFKGLNLGIIKLGVEGHSLAFGLNVGIAQLDTKLGQETRADARVGVGPVGVKAGGGVGVDREGLHADAGAKARVTDAVKAGGEVGAKIGPTTGAEAGIHAKAGEILHVKQDVASSISKDGFNNGYEGKVGLGKDFAHLDTDAHANLNNDSSAGARARAGIKDASVAAGADIASDGNHLIRPDVHLNADKGATTNRVDVGAQVGPKLDARLGTGYSHVDAENDKINAGGAGVGIGESGIGAKAIHVTDDSLHIHKIGVGHDYNSENW